MTVKELYQQLKPFVDTCPDEEVLIDADGTIFYPEDVDRSDWRDRSVVIYTTSTAKDLPRRKRNRR